MQLTIKSKKAVAFDSLFILHRAILVTYVYDTRAHRGKNAEAFLNYLSYLPQIIVQDPAQHDHRSDDRNPSQHLPVKNRDKYRIQYRLQSVDDGGCHRVRVFYAECKKDVGKPHLYRSEQEHGDKTGAEKSVSYTTSGDRNTPHAI